MPMVCLTNQIELERVLNKEKSNLLVFIGSKTCPGCEIGLKQLEAFAEKEQEIEMLIIYIEQIPEVIAKWELKVVPTILFVKNKQIVEKSEGFFEKRIETWIEKYKG